MYLAIDRKKLKLKHYLNIQKECKGYPTEEDYLYELVTALEYNEMLEEPFGAVFCRRQLSYVTDENDTSHESHLMMLQKMTKDGFFEQVEDGGVRIAKFKLKSHPWIKNQG